PRSCSVPAGQTLAGGGLPAGAVGGHGGPAGAGVGAKSAAAIPGGLDIEAGASARPGATPSPPLGPPGPMCERGGATAAKPGDGLLCVGGEVRMRLALPIVLTDVHDGWEVLQEPVDRGDRASVRDGRNRLAQSRKQASQSLGAWVGDVVLAEELPSQ